MITVAKIAIISGSPTIQTRLHGLTDHVSAGLVQLGHDVETLYVSKLPAEDLVHANFAGEEIIKAVDSVNQADAVVLASQVYKASYTGVLKLFLDLLPQKGLQDKVVFPLFIGGTIAHLLSIDYALKPVVSALGGTHILTGVYAVDQWVARRDDGTYSLSEELEQRLNGALTNFHHMIT